MTLARGGAHRARAQNRSPWRWRHARTMSRNVNQRIIKDDDGLLHFT
jgi:hypothetical protein